MRKVVAVDIPVDEANASVAGSFMSAFRASRSQPGDHTSEPWRWPRGIRSFRGYNPSFTPCLMMTGAQESCTKCQKVLSLFQPTFRLHNTFNLPQALLPEPRLPGRDHQPRIPCSSTLTRFRNTVRPCLFVSQTVWRMDYWFAVIPQSALCGRLVTCPTRDHRVIGFPVELPGNHYYRNYLRFNVCFVFNRSADLSCYEPVVRKVSRVLTSCEVRSKPLDACKLTDLRPLGRIWIPLQSQYIDADPRDP